MRQTKNFMFDEDLFAENAQNKAFLRNEPSFLLIIPQTKPEIKIKKKNCFVL